MLLWVYILKIQEKNVLRIQVPLLDQSAAARSQKNLKTKSHLVSMGPGVGQFPR